MPDNQRLATITRIVYEDSFGAHNGGADWGRTVERAVADQTTFAATIVWRSVQTARKIVALAATESPATRGRKSQ